MVAQKGWHRTFLLRLATRCLYFSDLLIGNAWNSATELTEGVWNWDSTGRPLYHTRWFVGQPDDVDNLNCVYMAKTALLYWRDANCSAGMYFICE